MTELTPLGGLVLALAETSRLPPLIKGRVEFQVLRTAIILVSLHPSDSRSPQPLTDLLQSLSPRENPHLGLRSYRVV